MKYCNTCGTTLPKDEFYRNEDKSTGRFYYSSECKGCKRERSKQWRKKNTRPKKERKPRQQGFRLLPEGKRKCSTCKEIKNKEDFYKDGSRASGTSSKCKICFNKYLKERRRSPERPDLFTRRKWSERNRERLREYDAYYRENNRDAKRLTEQKRRARKESLPSSLSDEELNEILEYFSDNCAICDEPAEHLDHFIPLSTGYGGTIKENIIPLCSKMNLSKHARNPFEWAEIYLTDEEKERFNEVVKYLADINKMSVLEYENYVHKCFEVNKTINL